MRSARPRPTTMVLAIAGLAAASGTVAATRVHARSGPSGERRLTLFYTAEVHGAVEPCGCTSDPLGDVSRLASLLADARKGGAAVALVDAGGLLYPEGAISAKERPSADLRAEFLALQFERMGLLGAALGETDAAGGAAHIRPARLASNLTGNTTVVRPPRVEKLGGIAIGVVGIGDPVVASAINAKTDEMYQAARRDVERLRHAGAEVVILLAAADKSEARKLARDAGADVIILGKRVGAGMARAEQVGQTIVVASADEMQRVGRLEIVLRAPVPAGTVAHFQDAGGPEAARLRRDEIDRTTERLRVDLSQWTSKRPAGGAEVGDVTDGKFVAAKQKELTELQDERRRLETPWAPPATGNYVVNTLVPLRRSLRRDSQVVAAMKRLDQSIAALNLRNAIPPPAAEPGRASYVGTDKCTACHASATAFWKRTVHAHAWKTLVDGGKQADYKCIGCHVTGFGQVGGTSLGFTKRLESVQCETCHGPGSLHVAGEGNEEPLAIRRDTPETVCLGCHTEQHSDTFKFEPYLRDIVGPGHAPKRRERLGAGVTGHDLRTAALAKAKLAGKTAAAGAAAAGTTAGPGKASGDNSSVKKM